ncbi:Filamentous hemagglutinin (plasmid) [Komagataeibacter xylinus E25]|nr:Filamentous hemagglutinin [Komagataeibacter xylinus E25]
MANDIANHADATAKTMGYQANVMNPEGATGGGTGGTMTAIGAGMAANAGGLLGAATRKDASSVTQSAIGSNVQIAAGSTSGDLSRSPSTSSHPLTNTFDAQQMQNDLQIQQVGSQVVGQVGGMVSDSLAASGLDAFKEGGYGRVLLETAGNAGVAALGHGSIGGSALATSAAGFGNLVTLPAAAGIAEAIAPNDRDAQYAIANTIETAASAGLGAAGGAVGGNSSVDAISGAGAASNVAQYNASADMAMEYEKGLAVLAGVSEVLGPVLVPALSSVAVAAAPVVGGIIVGTGIYYGGRELYDYVKENAGNTSIDTSTVVVSSDAPKGNVAGQDVNASDHRDKPTAEPGSVAAAGAPDPNDDDKENIRPDVKNDPLYVESERKVFLDEGVEASKSEELAARTLGRDPEITSITIRGENTAGPDFFVKRADGTEYFIEEKTLTARSESFSSLTMPCCPSCEHADRGDQCPCG